MVAMAQRVANLGTTIFAEINGLAQQYQAINLGQGAPDFNPPPHVMAALAAAQQAQVHQYAPGWGYPQLREAVAAHAARFYNQTLTPDQIAITSGATEGICAAMLGLINPGDEVILFEPFYDSYVPTLQWAGGVPRYLPLYSPDWHFDRDDLRALFNEKTCAIMINTPHNPTGKVFSQEELEFIAALCIEHDVIAITDEVYEHLVFDGRSHIPVATIPGMENRTLTLSSLGKTFSTTGWKIGWAMGDVSLVTGVFRARQFMTFATASVLQWAAIAALQAPDSYFEELQQTYQRRRDYLVQALAKTPLKPMQPEGGYFVMAETSALGLPTDRAVAEYLIKEIGVATIPPSAFYSTEHQHLAHHLTRLSICKSDETLQAAVARLNKLI